MQSKAMPIRKRLIAVWKNKWQFGAVVAVFSAMVGLFLASMTAFRSLEAKTYDIRFGLRGQVSTAQDSIVIVAIDDTTLVSMPGRWPYPNLIYAKAMANLLSAGAKLIVADLGFASTDSVASRQNMGLMRIVRASGKVILAGSLTPDQRSVVKPLPRLLQTGDRWGLRNLNHDPDGHVRRYTLYSSNGGEIYFPLATEALLALNSVDPSQARAEFANQASISIPGIEIGDRGLESILINFRGPDGSFPRYSFSLVVDDAALQLKEGMDRDAFERHRQRETFKNKIVFIGTTSGLLGKKNSSPFENHKGRARKLSNVEIHASALSTLLRRDHIRPENAVLGFLTVLVMSVLAMAAPKWLGSIRGTFVLLGLGTVFGLWALFAFINLWIWVEVIAPLTAALLAFGVSTVYDFTVEHRSRRRLMKTWQQYLPKDVIQSMHAAGEMPALAGERRELTVLFSDICGFTSFSERHSSKEVVGRLSQYLSSMAEIIFRHSGTLDKFVGDEIMAFFGAPHSYKNHSERACLAALEMVEGLSGLQRNWSQSTGYDTHPLQIGIGINTGNVILGNIGTSQLFNYSAVGDDVNLGAQLKAASSTYGTNIVISEFTYKHVRRKARVRELDVIRVKGKHKPVRIFELLGMDALPLIEQDLLIHVYTQGLNHFKNRNWYEALIEFKRIVRYFPSDGPTRLYIRRCMDCIENPPAESWNGGNDHFRETPSSSLLKAL
jgi:adenylate cyclase